MSNFCHKFMLFLQITTALVLPASWRTVNKLKVFQNNGKSNFSLSPSKAPCWPTLISARFAGFIAQGEMINDSIAQIAFDYFSIFGFKSIQGGGDK